MNVTMRKVFAALACAGVALVSHASGFSSSSSAPGSEVHFTPDQIVRFSKKVERTIAAKGAHVALIARMGRPASEMPEGMRFTHVGFAVYSTITTADGRKVPGYAMYNLYQRDAQPEVSDLVQDFPVDFFAAVSELDAGVIVPSPQLQEKLLSVIGTPAYRALHDPHYSLIANPYTLGKQNCTEFVLDVVESAMNDTSDVRRIKTVIRTDFKAQPVRVNALKLLAGAILNPDVAISDQEGVPVTATFETIAEFLRSRDPGSKVFEVLPD